MNMTNRHLASVLTAGALATTAMIVPWTPGTIDLVWIADIPS